MSLSLSTAVRTALAQAIITAAGASARLKLYNGARPAMGGVAGTLLATLTFGSVIGTAGSGAIDFDEAGVTQSNGSHVAGTPTWARIETSAGVAVADVDIGVGAGNWQFSGAVATGQNVTLSALSFTAANT